MNLELKKSAPRLRFTRIKLLKACLFCQCDIVVYFRSVKHYSEIITIDPGVRFGKPCIRGMRITVYDVLSWLASGMTPNDIVADFPELTEEDVKAALAYAADREHKIRIAS